MLFPFQKWVVKKAFLSSEKDYISVYNFRTILYDKTLDFDEIPYVYKVCRIESFKTLIKIRDFVFF